jgi:hypothetical protein
MPPIIPGMAPYYWIFQAVALTVMTDIVDLFNRSIILGQIADKGTGRPS